MTPSPGAHPIQAVIFDWGGTLTPWHEIDLPEQWRVYARTLHGVALDAPGHSAADLARAHELADRLLEVETAAWKRGRRDHLSASLAEVLDAAGLDPDHDRHHLALAAYRGFWEPHTRTDPQVRPLFEGLRARGIRVGVLSNTIWQRDYHRDIFARDGVLDLVDGDVYSSEIDQVKPHAEAFRAALAAVGAEAERSVYVGDRIFEDVWGPQQIGMRAIWIPHSDLPQAQRVDVEATPDAVAHELLDILGIVDGWRG